MDWTGNAFGDTDGELRNDGKRHTIPISERQETSTLGGSQWGGAGHHCTLRLHGRVRVFSYYMLLCLSSDLPDRKLPLVKQTENSIHANGLIFSWKNTKNTN